MIQCRNVNIYNLHHLISGYRIIVLIHFWHPKYLSPHFPFQYKMLDRVPFFPFRIEDRQRVPGVARARICDLLLLADKEFFEKDANSSLKHVVRRMMHAVAQADIIFRNADFNEDGVPDNIGKIHRYTIN